MIEYDEIKKYGATHFEEVKEIIKQYFSKDEMKEIIEEEYFKIGKEYYLMKFTKEIISETGEFFIQMITFIKNENLTITEFEEYLRMMEPQETETEELQNIIKKGRKFYYEVDNTSISNLSIKRERIRRNIRSYEQRMQWKLCNKTKY